MLRARAATTIAATAVLLTALPLAALPAHAASNRAAALPHIREYVALGDSWSADVVIADSDGPPDSTYAPVGCAQRHRDYPKLVAKALGVQHFKDATCGSATTYDFTHRQKTPTGQFNPPQFDRLTKRTGLVTVGIGGNDAGFAGAAVSCINLLPFNNDTLANLPPAPVGIPVFSSQPPVGGCKQRFEKFGHDQLAEQIRRAEPKLVRALRQIHRLSPHARVLMLNYLDAIPKQGCYPFVPISDEDMAYLHKTFLHLNAMVKRAARQGGAQLVDTFAASHGHDVCQLPTVRYVEGLGGASVNGGPAVAVPAHPNEAGAQSQFRSVLATLRPRK